MARWNDITLKNIYLGQTREWVYNYTTRYIKASTIII